MSRGPVLLIGVAAAAIATVWAVREFAPAGGGASPSSVNDKAVATPAEVTNLPAAAVPTSAAAVASAATEGRFKLVGVLANGSEGVALISVDGHPARAFRVGAAVEDKLVVQQVSGRGVTLGPSGGGAAIALDVSVAPASARPTAPASAAGPEQLSKHPPLPPRPAPAPTKPGEGSAQPVDDGSWRPPSRP